MVSLDEPFIKPEFNIEFGITLLSRAAFPPRIFLLDLHLLLRRFRLPPTISYCRESTSKLGLRESLVISKKGRVVALLPPLIRLDCLRELVHFFAMNVVEIYNNKRDYSISTCVNM